MRTKAVSFLFSIVLCNLVVETYAQSHLIENPIQNHGVALFILNSTIIANGSYAHLESKYFKDAETAETYEGDDGPGILKGIPTAGMINLSYAGPISSKSFIEIGKMLGLYDPLIFFLDGRKLSTEQAATLRMTPEAIGQVQIDRKSTPMHTIVSISVSKHKEPIWPPGTVWVR